MAYFKVVSNPCDTVERLENVCHYIIQWERTRGMVGGRGLRPECAFEDISEAQALWDKSFGRRAYHCVLAFDDMEVIVPTEAMEIACLVAGFFFPAYQVLFGVHTEQEHLHIHFVISCVSLADGRKLHIDYGMLAQIREKINMTVQAYIG